MYLFTISPTQACILLPFLLFLPTHVLAFAFQRRGCVQCCPLSPQDSDVEEAPTLSSPTSDQSPGIGVEFETGDVLFGSKTCGKEDTDKAKGKLVNNRRGVNWELTADSIGDINRLTAEYILDGRKIKLGTNAATKAASEVAHDIVRCTITA